MTRDPDELIALLREAVAHVTCFQHCTSYGAERCTCAAPLRERIANAIGIPCTRTACRAILKPEQVWTHRDGGAPYCGACARLINRYNRRIGAFYDPSLIVRPPETISS